MAPRLRCDGGITGSLFFEVGFEMRFPQLHMCFCERYGRFVFIARGKIMCFIFRFKLAINKSPLINKKKTCYYNIEKVQITVVYIVTVFHSI